ncbi:MAG: XRE family transcriptional regulator [Clostridiales bacterium]|nr:MAG: XRE family transcriptional regulator [Clostridiales bacterium]
MIIADKILSLRKTNGMSQEELAEKLNVSRQSVSKWESAAAVPDVSKILEMSKIFGVTTDYLLKEDLSVAEYTGEDYKKTAKVSIQEANNFMDAIKKNSKWVALGVMLCICSPIILIILGGMNGSGYNITEALAGGVGLAVLFIMIAAAVVIFIINDSRISQYKYIKNGEFELDFGVEGIIKEHKRNYEKKYTLFITVGVVLCILCALPLILAGVFMGEDAVMIFISLTALILFCVAVAVFLFIISGSVMEGYNQLLRYGEFAPENTKNREMSQRIGGIYWPIAVVVYLAWSFITNDWHITWVVWPVAGIIFGGICAFLGHSSDK